jgi:phospholipase/lecithinase/hemolysin
MRFFFMKNILRYAISGFISFAFIVLSIPLQAGQFNAIYVFGDSLSDIGNDSILTNNFVPPSLAYYQGRFSNGPVAFEYLWKTVTGSNQVTLKPSLNSNVNYITDKAVSFAYGGATTEIQNYTPGLYPVDGLVGQVNNFIKIVQSNQISLDKKALYALWAGGNDYLLPPGSVSYPNNTDCPTTTPPIDHVVCNITDTINKLYSLVGARYFIVPNLPDLGTLPIVNDVNYYPLGSSALFTQLTIAHNSALKSALGKLTQKYPGIHIIYVDVYSLMNSLIQTFPHHADAGPAGDCLFINPANCTQPLNGFNAPGYVFWDIEHPTTGVHSILAATMSTALQNMQ